MSIKRELIMTISLNALEHLGINLYSNIPAVLSEIVANAWDADAKLVTVTVDKGTETITIEDDGIGMDRDAVIDRFLTVGFKRRDELGDKTPGGRKPMGRKGLGQAVYLLNRADRRAVYDLRRDPNGLQDGSRGDPHGHRR
jgi:HSP90 family molecular chaperone